MGGLCEITQLTRGYVVSKYELARCVEKLKSWQGLNIITKRCECELEYFSSSNIQYPISKQYEGSIFKI